MEEEAEERRGQEGRTEKEGKGEEEVIGRWMKRTRSKVWWSGDGGRWRRKKRKRNRERSLIGGGR